MTVHQMLAISRDDEKTHREMWGGFNDMPRDMVECSASDFWHAFYNATPRRVEGRQAFNLGSKREGAYTELTLFFGIGGLCDQNFALVHQHENAIGITPKFYKFGCQHQDERKQIGRCYHEHTCVKCGRVTTVDSGD